MTTLWVFTDAKSFLLLFSDGIKQVNTQRFLNVMLINKIHYFF